MTTAKRILIVATGSAQQGAGHLVRSGAIAEACLAGGWQVTGLCNAEGESLAQWTWNYKGFAHSTAGAAENSNQFLHNVHNHLQQCKPHWLLIDSYNFDDAFLAACPSDLRIAVLDDVPNTRILERADLIINPNLSVTTTEYVPKALVGPDYAPLRSAFRDESFQGGSDILIITGGNDATDLRGQCIDQIAPRYAVKVTGSSASLPANVIALGTLNAAQLAKNLATCHCAILAAGSVVWEALTVGTPFIAIQVAANQERIVRGLQETGWALTRTRAQLGSLANDIAALNTAPANAQARLDGRGAKRIVDYLEHHTPTMSRQPA